MQEKNPYIPVIILIGFAIIILGAFVLVNSGIFTMETGTSELSTTEVTEEATVEVTAEMTAEMTDELIMEADSGEETEEATPTSQSRVTQSTILESDTSVENTTESTDEAITEVRTEATAEVTEAVDGGMSILQSDPDSPAGASPSALNPSGTVAQRQSVIWWVAFGLGAAIYVGVVGLVLRLVYVNWKGTHLPLSKSRSQLLIWGGGIVLPIAVLSLLFVLTLDTMVVLATSNTTTNRTIQVTGNQWWWEVRYPESDIVTANEIHIPVGETIKFELTSADVIHSFWVPELGGKLDLIPGRTNTFWLQADEAGTYRGQCAEYCGRQHAHMAFLVIAHPPEEFQQWLNHQEQPASAPQSELAVQGQTIFLNSQCAGCHTIAGTDATGDQGPDLTHVGSRRTLGAVTLLNTHDNLKAWIRDSHQFKPGNLMPAQDVSDEELDAITTYLNSLD